MEDGRLMDKCPGQDRKDIISRVVQCKCGAEVEIFSDEIRIKCHNCKKFIYQEDLPNCLQWCKFPCVLKKLEKEK
jgi:hypothetical protein